ncbi:MAG: CBU_0592 family membrane protein [Microbacterium sp.]
MTPFDLAGWIGGATVAAGYMLVSLHRLDPAGRSYQILNVVGGLLLTVTALYRLAYPNMIINMVWIVFGSYALIRTCPAAARFKSARRRRVEPPSDVGRDGLAPTAEPTRVPRRTSRRTPHGTSTSPSPPVAAEGQSCVTQPS